MGITFKIRIRGFKKFKKALKKYGIKGLKDLALIAIDLLKDLEGTYKAKVVPTDLPNEIWEDFVKKFKG